MESINPSIKAQFVIEMGGPPKPCAWAWLSDTGPKDLPQKEAVHPRAEKTALGGVTVGVWHLPTHPPSPVPGTWGLQTFAEGIQSENTPREQIVTCLGEKGEDS